MNKIKDFLASQSNSKLQHAMQAAYKVLPPLIESWATTHDRKTILITSLVVTLYQINGPLLDQRGVSFLLAPVGPPDDDPVNRFIGDMLSLLKSRIPKEPTHASRYATTAQAPKRMSYCLREAKNYEVNDQNHCKLQQLYFASQQMAYGRGLVRPFRDGWTKEFGLITDSGKSGFLRIENETDRQHFLHLMKKEPNSVLLSNGIDSKLNDSYKPVSLSGSIDHNEWNSNAWQYFMEHGAPVLVMPHCIKEAPKLEEDALVKNLAAMRSTSPFTSKHIASLCIADSSYIQSCEQSIRKALSHFPSNYDYSVRTFIHQLGIFCQDIANHLSDSEDSFSKERELLFWDLFSHTVRGVAICILGLQWQGLGLKLPCCLETTHKTLQSIRSREAISRRDLLRTTPLKSASERDALLEVLESANLIRQDHKTVSQVTYEEFVHYLYRHPDIPQPLPPEKFVRERVSFIAK